MDVAGGSMKPSRGLIQARLLARERIQAGHGDREAAARYRELAASGKLSEETAADYMTRAEECERLASLKLRSKV